MNTLIYQNNLSIAELDGKRLVTKEKPPLSFQFDELQFHQNNKSYILNEESVALDDNQISEVEGFINSIEIDEQLGEMVSDNLSNYGYLTSTDWYIIRKFETGVEIPSDVIIRRQLARESMIDLSQY